MHQQPASAAHIPSGPVSPAGRGAHGRDTALDFATWYDSSVELRRGAFVSDVSTDCIAQYWPELCLAA
jgi:hypothetical protein